MNSKAWNLNSGREWPVSKRAKAALPWMLVIVLSLILLLSNWRTPYYQAYPGTPVLISYPYTLFARQHFPGAYGSDAMQKLISWSDRLFASTMTMYKENGIKACTQPGGSHCSEAVSRHHAPEPINHDFYNLVNPYITCPDPDAMARVGNDGEGGKLICTDLLHKEGCVVFSLGSNGQFDFELDILETTDCDVYTFDCTYDGRSIAGYEDRHTYLKQCIGSPRKEKHDARFITLSNAARQMALDQITLLKIDIEGSEYDVMAGWAIQDSALPEMVAVEVHRSQVIYDGLRDADGIKVRGMRHGPEVDELLIWPPHDLTLSDLSLFFGSLARLGYAVASRDDNGIGRCCTELLLLKVIDYHSV